MIQNLYKKTMQLSMNSILELELKSIVVNSVFKIVSFDGSSIEDSYVSLNNLTHEQSDILIYYNVFTNKPIILIERFMSNNPIEPFTYSNGESVLNAYSHQKNDVIFNDIICTGRLYDV